VYLGPFNATIGPATNDERPTVSPNFVTTVLNAATVLATGLLSHDATWSVYSPRNNAAVPIARIWVDEAFDTQRRRGFDAPGRFTQSGAPFVS